MLNPVVIKELLHSLLQNRLKLSHRTFIFNDLFMKFGAQTFAKDGNDGLGKGRRDNVPKGEQTFTTDSPGTKLKVFSLIMIMKNS